MNELVSTEETYIYQLQFIIKDYISVLTRKKILNKEEIKIVFPHIDLLHQLHCQILSGLKEKLQYWNAETTYIGKTFLEYMPYFKMYQTYINNHRNAVLYMHSALKKNKAFQKHIAETERKQNSSPLASLLMCPVQRLPRY
eukprot:UN27139